MAIRPTLAAPDTEHGGCGPSQDCTLLYIDGQWRPSRSRDRVTMVDPATEESYGEVVVATEADVDDAVQAAKAASDGFGRTSVDDRKTLLAKIIGAMEARRGYLAQAVSQEMGAPIAFADAVHVERPLNHLRTMIDVLDGFAFEELFGSHAILRREAIGVCGLITAWNWPLSLLMAKLAPALAAGCTAVVKPSEIAPLSTTVLTSLLHDAKLPPGVVNLVHGDGLRVGAAITAHPDVDMVSFTGSTRAGVRVAEDAAPTVKRVALELGGKSPNIILPDADLDDAVYRGVMRCFTNTGQSCQAPTRMLVHASQRKQALAVVRRAVRDVVVGHPRHATTTMGPLASAAQFEKVQAMIQAGLNEGATLAAGGLGRPAGLNRGFYARPTVMADVTSDMTVAREEIFGPVLVVLFYETDDEAIEIANDTNYGLAAYVESRDMNRARRVAREVKAGRVYLNGAPGEPGAPFGGYRHSGNGREGGRFALEEYTEMKAIFGHRDT